MCVGVDSKLPTVDAMSPVAVQPAAAAGQQAQSNVAVAAGSAAGGNQQQQQQSYHPAAMHPAAAAAAAPTGYGYYYPSAGILPVGSYYAPVLQMGGLVSTVDVSSSECSFIMLIMRNVLCLHLDLTSVTRWSKLTASDG